MFGSRRLAVGFALSVLVNLFLVGVVVGRLTMPGMARPQQAAVLVPHEQIRALPLSERWAFTAAMWRHAPQIRAAHERVREAKRAAEAAIAAPHYDPALLAARFAQVRDRQLAQEVLLHQAVIEALGTLSPTSRAQIARAAQAKVEAAP